MIAAARVFDVSCPKCKSIDSWDLTEELEIKNKQSQNQV